MYSNVLFWACSYLQISTFMPWKKNLHFCWKSNQHANKKGKEQAHSQGLFPFLQLRERGWENKRESYLSCVNWASLNFVMFYQICKCSITQELWVINNFSFVIENRKLYTTWVQYAIISPGQPLFWSYLNPFNYNQV